MSVQYNANQDIKTTRKFFTGATALRTGQVLCLDEAATKTDANPSLRLGQAVKVVTSTNLNFIAGIVPDSEAGKINATGTFVELLQPQSGDVLDIEVDGTVAVAAGDTLKNDNTKGALIKDASPAAGVTKFRALEAQAVASKVVIRCQCI
jgi:hypothetical protein